MVSKSYLQAKKPPEEDQQLEKERKKSNYLYKNSGAEVRNAEKMYYSEVPHKLQRQNR